MKLVSVFTDGSCWPNPGGRGGWAAVILVDGVRSEIKGHDPGPTTNNRMEITAAIKALETLEPGCCIEIFTDSEYLRKSASGWIGAWRKRGWVTRDGSPVKNQDLWMRLDELQKQHRVRWTWIKAHQDKYTENNRCDALAEGMREQGALCDLLLNYDAV